MLRTAYDIIAQVLVRAGTSSTTTGLYTDTALRGWADDANRWASGFKKWPYTEGRVTTTFTGSEENNYPEGWRPDSIRLLQIGGKRFRKLNFEDYQIFKEEQPGSDDRVYSDFGRVLFVNTNADASGSLTVYGQYLPAALGDGDGADSLTIFSDTDQDGNDAIVEEMLRYAKEREKKMDEAQLHHNRAIEILEKVWKQFSDEQFGYQGKRGFFERIDVLEGGLRDETFKRDQFI